MTDDFEDEILEESPAAGSAGSRKGLGIRCVGGNRFELVHPPCVEETFPDYEEGLELWRVGDPEAAESAFRYALQECRDSLYLHVALGQIAMDERRDPLLACGHLGYALELVEAALPPGFRGLLPPDRPGNQPIYEAIEGLVHCYQDQGQTRKAADVLARKRAWGG